MNVALYVLVAPLILLLLVVMFMLSSCTYSISLVHTEGTASDVVDNDQKPSTDVSPTITAIPGSPL